MSIKFISDLVFDVYIKKELLDEKLESKTDLEKYIKKLFIILNDKYNIHMEGFYDVIIYIDKYYGIVFHLEKESSDYCEYFKNQVDMKISIIKKDFYYKVNDILKELLDKVEIYIKNDNIYLKIKNKLTKKEMMILLENSEVVFNL